MMSFLQLIDYLKGHGIAVTVARDDILEIHGNLAVITPRVDTAIRANKGALIAWFREPANDGVGGQEKTDAPKPSLCITCGGENLVVDQVGSYCVDCRRRPGEPATSDTEPATPPPL